MKAAPFSAIFLSLTLLTTLRAVPVPPPEALSAREQQIVAAAAHDSQTAPRFNGALLVGVRPGTPLIYELAVSGQRPVTFEARHLPPGLRLDPATGLLSGSLSRAGDFEFTAVARNAEGEGQAKVKIRGWRHAGVDAAARLEQL